MENWYNVVHFLVMVGFVLLLGAGIIGEDDRYPVNAHARRLINISHQNPPHHYMSTFNRRE